MRIETAIADSVSAAACSFRGFLLACAVTLLWAAVGPHFDYSDSWQLVINTGTTIATFLMSFLIGANQMRQAATIEALLRYQLHATEAVHALLVADARTAGAAAGAGVGEAQPPQA